MKAAGLSYPELDADAAKLDGEPFLQVTGSEISQLLAKGVATLPSYEPKFPHRREQATQKLFSDWVACVNGDTKARARLEAAGTDYDTAVVLAKELALTAFEVAPGVMLCDVVENPDYDKGTLTALLESRAGCKITVLRRGVGPIAAIHGVQYSMSVVKAHQAEFNLQKLLPPDTKAEPQFGVISNVSFLLHVSQPVWEDQILPSLRQLTGLVSVR
jgi:hypothetical protein